MTARLPSNGISGLKVKAKSYVVCSSSIGRIFGPSMVMSKPYPHPSWPRNWPRRLTWRLDRIVNGTCQSEKLPAVVPGLDSATAARATYDAMGMLKLEVFVLPRKLSWYGGSNMGA
jgi:hypothetical protein